jgi:hypothetical protein
MISRLIFTFLKRVWVLLEVEGRRDPPIEDLTEDSTAYVIGLKLVSFTKSSNRFGILETFGPLTTTIGFEGDLFIYAIALLTARSSCLFMSLSCTITMSGD